jgi:ABC-2 type transport system permease protein
MIRLLSAELLRARSRRLVKVLLILGVVGIAVGVTIGAFNSSKPSPGVVARAEAKRDADVQKCLNRAVSGGQAAAGLTREEGCSSPIRLYLPQNAFDVNNIGDILRGTSVNLIVVGWLLGASLAGAEWAAGTMTTLLTWEPRRLRVLFTKFIAAVVTVLVLSLLLQAALVGALWLLAATRGVNVPDPELWHGILGSILRVSAISSLAGVFGLAIAMITRSVTAAMASGFVYLAVVEGLIRGYKPGLAQYLIGDNAIAWITGRPFTTSDPSHPVTLVHAVVVLSLYAVVLMTAAAVSFRTRDVT